MILGLPAYFARRRTSAMLVENDWLTSSLIGYSRHSLFLPMGLSKHSSLLISLDLIWGENLERNEIDHKLHMITVNN